MDLEAYLQLSPGFIFVKDAKNLAITACSLSFAKEAGVKKIDQILGMTDYNLPWAEFADTYRNDDNYVLDKGEISKIETFVNFQGEKSFWLVQKKLIEMNNRMMGVVGNAITIPGYLQKKLDCFKRYDQKINGENASYQLKKVYPGLTLRESQVFFYCLRRNSAKQIARILQISHRTVEKHLETVKNKFSVKTREELHIYAVINHLLEIIPQAVTFN
jgi:DNA-binding CsgD family transcriptional regulator